MFKSTLSILDAGNHIERIDDEIVDRDKYICLDRNESPFEIPGVAVANALSELNADKIRTYPSKKILVEIAALLGLDYDRCIFTRGAVEGIRMVMDQAFRYSPALFIYPTFAMVDIFRKIYRVNSTEFFYNEDLQLNLRELFHTAAAHRMLYLTNPNSPLGSSIGWENINQIAKYTSSNNILLLLDATYAEFDDFDPNDLTTAYDSVIVIRSMSKYYCMAGLRFGYIIMSKNVASFFKSTVVPHAIDQMSSLIVRNVLRDKIFLQTLWEKWDDAKEYLRRSLTLNKVSYIDTKTNFLHIEVCRRRSEFISFANQEGILLRGGIPLPNYQDYLKVSVGRRDQTDYLLGVLKKFMVLS